MSGRRQRSKTARALASEEQQLYSKRKSYQKPKYLEDRSETPNSTRSRVSTPNSSRNASRSPSPSSSTLTGRRRNSVNSHRKKSSRGRKRGGLNSSGSNTPIGRGSRSSSVTSANYGRKSAYTTPKIKTKLSRGYNPSLVNYKDSEYHYGSDFEEYEDEREEEPASEDSSDEDEEDVDSDDMKVESDVDFDPADSVSKYTPADSRSATPIPFWLRTDEEDPAPPLVLPPSSEDLLISRDLVLKAASAYEVLRHYRLLLRLSPFRFEDFCAALAAEEQSNLLSEVHIALLRSMLRAEEKDNTTFAPIDQKDSVNSFLYFMDSMTWPYCLKAFLAADSAANAEPLEIMKVHPEYPMTELPSSNWVQARVDMLSYLSNQFLATSFVREDIATEGAPTLEDHCRVCHRLGDMLVCDQCSGVFHVACLDPPVLDVPEDEWTCFVCTANEVEGVTDCDSEQERRLLRQECLGYDRAGNKYWFLCRRMFVEASDGSVSYYTSVKQFEELFNALDPDLYEADLCDVLTYNREEIERQMNITELITNEKKGNVRKSYLEVENAAIDKNQEERELKRQEEAEKRRQLQEEAALKTKEEEEEKQRKLEEDEEEKKRKLRDERLKKREENRGDGFQATDDLMSELENSEVKLEGDVEMDGVVPMPETEMEIKTEDTEVKEEKCDVTTMDVDPKEEPEIKEEKPIDQVPKNEVKQISLLMPSSKPTTAPSILESELRMTRNKVQQISTGTLYFKLGQDNCYKLYVNQYTTNPSALSKVQATEERVKRTHLSHKFSLTEASSFKWVGAIHGTRTQILATLRATLLQFENSIPTIFLHVNWGLLRKAWIAAVTKAESPRNLARTLIVLQCCMKPCLLLTVWTEALGHTHLKKFTGQMKEDKKKQEKKERREREEEEEKLRPYLGFVKYTLGLKHQVAKQKGEEYRVHGQTGWLWLSSTRNFCPTDARKVGLRAGPSRLAVNYTDTRDKSFKIVLMEPNAFEYLLKRQDEIDLQRAMGMTEEQIAEIQAEEYKDDSPKNKERMKLEMAIKHARLARQVADESLFNEVVNVEEGLSKNTRTLYPKVGGKTKYLNDFLSRRIQLKTLEEKQFEPNGSTVNETANPKLEALNKFINESKKSLWTLIAKLKESPADSALEDFAQVPGEMKCYSTQCSQGGFGFECYSWSCRSTKVKQKSADHLMQEVCNCLTAISKEGLNHGIKIEYKEPPSREKCISELQTLIKILMKKKEDEEKKSLTNGELSSSEPQTPTSQESSDESKNQPRIFSTTDTSGKIYLKKLPDDAKGKPKQIIYPPAPSFYASSRKDYNILLLAKHEVRKMARRAGTTSCEGFSYNAKTNYHVWPYPCPRPAFKTAWLYRTASLESLQAVGLQLRILWACLKWDDMQTRPPSSDGKHQITTDSAITTTEILKTRSTGRFKEKTEYLVRKITIPLDVPKTVKEVTPIRSGLRKRKRAESPEHSEPKLSEEWVEEEKLELWEIRGFKEKIEREKAMSLTRSRTGTVIKEPQRLDPSDLNKLRRHDGDMKTKMEETLRLQREALQQKAQAMSPASSVVTSGTPTIIRRITNPDGSVSLVRTIARAVPGSQASTAGSTPVTTGVAGTKRIFVTKDGRVVPGQVVSGQQTGGNQIKLAESPSTVTSSQPAATPTTPSNQKVQIVRSSDGKIQVRGLLPGQQLIQTPDGKLQIINQNSQQQVVTTTASTSGTRLIVQSPTTVSQQQVVTPQPKVTNSVLTPGTNKIIATQLAPGSQIPPNMTAFVSGGKTYCIPKASATMAGANQPAASVNNVSQTTVTPSSVTSIMSTSTTQGSATTPSTPTQAGQVQTKQKVEVRPLGQNVVSVKGNQMFVHGPNIAEAQMIAQQLSSGAAKLATLNGKQVLISTVTQTLAVQQPEPVATPLPPQPSATLPQQILQSPVKNEPADSLKLPTEPIPPQDLNKDAEKSPAKIPNQITAQLVSTPQGPRIILQGIQGSALPKEYLLSIQQQVKTQLIKAQAEAKQQNKVPPTKVIIQLPPSIQAQLEKNAAAENSSTPTPSAAIVSTTPTAPLTQVAQSVIRASTQVVNTAQSPRPVAPQISASGTPRPVVLQQLLSSNPGQKFVIVRPDGTRMVVTTPQQQTVTSQGVKAVGGVQLATNQTVQNSTQSQVAVGADQPSSNDDTFELTPDYIQRAISDALKNQDLSPEIEQKLLALQHHTSEKGLIAVRTTSQTPVASKKAQGPIDPLTGEPMDEEWEPASKGRANLGSRRRKLVSSDADSTSQSPTPAAATPVQPTPSTPPRQRSRSGQRPPVVSHASAPATGPVVYDEKKRQAALHRLQSILNRHKEQLKKDIARKRSQQEKELQIEIQKEIEKEKQAVAGLGQLAANSYEAASTALSDGPSTQKRKRRDSSIGSETAAVPSTSPGSPPKKKKRTSSSSSMVVKKNKLYCICKTKYDPSKFYVGCDICSNWFHGSCIGISESRSKSMTEYVCDECQSARDKHEIYCLCRQPYDESQFYIGCEKCSDWFHGHCVGILQVEANSIDEYLCPRCDPSSAFNKPNAKVLNDDDYELIKKLVKQVMVHRHSVPFKEPVNPSSVPNYYKIVKVPMDLQTIEERVSAKSYRKLSDFVGDVMRIFENCRFFNQPNSQVVKSAEALESFFASKLSILREKIGSS